jgi:hypothetical protein
MLYQIEQDQFFRVYWQITEVMADIAFQIDPDVAALASPDEARELLDEIKIVKEWLDALTLHLAQHVAATAEAA